MATKLRGFAVGLAGFTVCFLELGTFKSLGVFEILLQKDLQTTNTKLGAWIAMCQMAAYILAPGVTWACSTFGERQVVVLGGVLCTCGISLASFTDSVHWFGLLMTIAGFGFGMTYMASIAIVPKYFPLNMSSMVGVMGAGGSLGLMISPPVTEFLIEKYGWRGAMLMLGAINANNVVCGAIMQPIHQGNNYLPILLDNEQDQRNSEENISEETKSSMISSLSLPIIKAVRKLTCDLRSVFVDTPKFIPVAPVMMLIGFNFAGWAIFLVPHGVLKGMNLREASFLSSFGGIGSLFGRLLMGPIVQSDYITALQYLITLSSVNAIAFFLDIIFISFAPLAILAFINGFAIGTLPLLTFSSAVEIVGEDLAVLGFSYVSICFAFGNFIGGLVLGHSFDEHSSTNFALLGGISAINSIFGVLSTDSFERLISVMAKKKIKQKHRQL